MGVTAQVGQGPEFTAITAVVLGGVVLGGGRGWVVAAIAGALTLQALDRLFTQLAFPSTARPALQGVIMIAAVAYAARSASPPSAPQLPRALPPPGDEPPTALPPLRATSARIDDCRGSRRGVDASARHRCPLQRQEGASLTSR